MSGIQPEGNAGGKGMTFTRDDLGQAFEKADVESLLAVSITLNPWPGTGPGAQTLSFASSSFTVRNLVRDLGGELVNSAEAGAKEGVVRVRVTPEWLTASVERLLRYAHVKSIDVEVAPQYARSPVAAPLLWSVVEALRDAAARGDLGIAAQGRFVEVARAGGEEFAALMSILAPRALSEDVSRGM